jgi:hypothetical protein
MRMRILGISLFLLGIILLTQRTDSQAFAVAGNSLLFDFASATGHAIVGLIALSLSALSTMVLVSFLFDGDFNWGATLLGLILGYCDFRVVVAFNGLSHAPYPFALPLLIVGIGLITLAREIHIAQWRMANRDCYR